MISSSLTVMTSDTRSLICGHVLLPNRACRPSAIVFGLVNATILPLALANAQSAASFVPVQSKEILCYDLGFWNISCSHWMARGSFHHDSSRERRYVNTWIKVLSTRLFEQVSIWHTERSTAGTGWSEGLTSCTEIKYLHALQSRMICHAKTESSAWHEVAKFDSPFFFRNCIASKAFISSMWDAIQSVSHQGCKISETAQSAKCDIFSRSSVVYCIKSVRVQSFQQSHLKQEDCLPVGSAARIIISGLIALAAIEIPEIRPPPETGTMIASRSGILVKKLQTHCALHMNNVRIMMMIFFHLRSTTSCWSNCYEFAVSAHVKCSSESSAVPSFHEQKRTWFAWYWDWRTTRPFFCEEHCIDWNKSCICNQL